MYKFTYIFLGIGNCIYSNSNSMEIGDNRLFNGPISGCMYYIPDLRNHVAI